MKAVILAAGQGSRLEQKRPKCLVKIAGVPLIYRQLDALGQFPDLEKVIVVAGYQHEKVKASLPAGVEVVVNDAYATTNSLASLACARDAIGDSPIVVMNSDVLFHPWILRELVPNTVLYDSSAKFDPEQMKLLVRHGELVSMSKGLPKKYSAGENIGVWRLEDGRRAAKVAAQIAEKKPNAWVPAVLNSLAPKFPIRCVDVAGMPWHEIDYPSDLAYARRVVLPAIEV